MPLSFTRPVADFRIGITTIKEKWEALFPARYSYYPVEYLREKYGSGSGYRAAGPVYQRLRNPHQWADRGGGITALPGEAIVDDNDVIAFRGAPRKTSKTGFTQSRNARLK